MGIMDGKSSIRDKIIKGTNYNRHTFAPERVTMVFEKREQEKGLLTRWLEMILKES